MTEPLRFREFDAARIAEEIRREEPAFRAQIAALEEARRTCRPTQKQMREWVITV